MFFGVAELLLKPFLMIISVQEWEYLYREIRHLLGPEKFEDCQNFYQRLGEEDFKRMEALLGYYRAVLLTRSQKTVPLSIELTFKIIELFHDKNQAFKDLRDLRRVERYQDMALINHSVEIFRILGQIVDQNQSSKFTLSFSNSLRELCFVDYSLISQTRHNLTHQAPPSSKVLEFTIVKLLSEILVLYWDKQAHWLEVAGLMEGFGSKIGQKKKKSVSALNSVNSEYVDLLATQKRFEDFRELCKTNFKAIKDLEKLTQSFVKTHLKKVHRKLYIVNLVIVELNHLITEQITSQFGEEDDNSPLKSDYEVLRIIFKQLMALFAKNRQMFAKLVRKTKVMNRVNQLICMANLDAKYSDITDALEDCLKDFLKNYDRSSAEEARAVGKLKVFLGDSFRDLFQEVEEVDFDGALLGKRLEGEGGSGAEHVLRDEGPQRNEKKLKIQVGLRFSKFLKKSYMSYQHPSEFFEAVNKSLARQHP